MSSFETSQLIQDVVAGIVLIGGIIVYSKGRIPQQTIKNLMESNESYIELGKARDKKIADLEKKVREMADLHATERLELNKAISDLQGQVKVYKELPLQELADGITKVVDSNAKILDTLQNSALIAAQHEVHLQTKVDSQVTKV